MPSLERLFLVTAAVGAGALATAPFLMETPLSPPAMAQVGAAGLRLDGGVVEPPEDSSDQPKARHPRHGKLPDGTEEAGGHRLYCIVPRATLVAFRDAKPPGAIGRRFIQNGLADLRCTLDGVTPRRCIVKRWAERPDGTPMGLPKIIRDDSRTKCFRGSGAIRRWINRPPAEGVWWEAEP